MLRGRFKRSQIGRNPSNLHVIPIASVLNNRPIQLNSGTALRQEVFPSAIPIVPPFDNNINLVGKFNKTQRKRQRKRKRFSNKRVLHDGSDYQWYNPNIKNQIDNNVTNAAPVNELENVEVMPEASPPVEEDFEEVEVASSEGEGKKIPVGFRKTKLHYLNYKKSSFFRPKFYSFSSQRTVINCLNVDNDDDNSVDIDVVSEAEYDEYEIGDQCDSVEKFGKIIEIEEESSNEVLDREEINEEMEEEDAHVITDEVNEDSSHTITISDDESTHKNCTGIGKSDSNEDTVFVTRIYKTGIESNDNLTQGKSLIQEKLDTWESHLIGLEYLLEIRDKNDVSVLKYYCVLCDEDLEFQELPEVYVINHVNGCNHIAKYLEKHFPNCGFKFDEKNSYDLVIQKFCEKINDSLGYYFVCITNDDYYAENKLKIKEIIENASHPIETDLKFDKSEFEKTVDSDLSENISNIIKDVITKVIPENEVTTELKNAKDDKCTSEVKVTDPAIKKKNAETFSKDKKKYAGNKSLSSFLRLSFAASTKLGKSSKEFSNKSKVAQNKITESNKEPILKSDKSHCEQQVTEVVKLNNEPKELAKKEPKGPVNNASVENVKPKKIETVKKPLSKSARKYINLKTKLFAIPNKSKKVTSKENEELKNKQLAEEKFADETQNLKKTASSSVQNLKKTANNSAVLKSHKVTSKIIQNIANKKAFQNKEKLLKATIHSKYCRKRILDKGIARLKLAAKATTKGRLVTQVSNKSNVKCTPIAEKVGSDASETITKKINKPELKENKIAVTSTLKKKALFTVIPVRKLPAVNSKSSVTARTSSYQKTTESVSKNEGNTIVNDSSRWIPMKASSPVLTSDISLFLNKISGGQSENSVKKRRLSKSPIRKITSPLRSKNHSRRHSKSPRRKRESKSPIRRKSKSPYRKLSKSPIRRSRSPVRRRSRSPLRRRSRSPRRRSRSPLRHRSRSPVRRQSRSPFRRHSKSPGRRRSRSPIRRRSRSPLRRRSRSPLRKRSRSPLRKRSRSPLRKRSRSPLRKRSRSPLRRLSRSPLRRRSRSPVKWQSRSPRRRQSRSPVNKQSRSPYRRLSRSPIQNHSNAYIRVREVSSNIGQPSSSREYYSPDERRYKNNAYDFPKHLDLHESEINRSRDASKRLHSSKLNKPDRYKSQAMSPREITDLDPVSDEDESIYFSDKHLRSEDISPTSKGLISKMWQKLSVTDNPSDLGLNNFVEFVETHRAELEEFIALKSGKSEKINPVKIDSNLQQQALFFQQYLLANLAGSIRESGPSVSNVQYAPPPQAQFLPENVSHRFGPPTVNMPSPANMPFVPPRPAPMQPRFFPPNISVPPPHLFQHRGQPNQDFSPKPKPAPEVMFKDLKATVNKLFGANEGGMKQGVKPQVPGYVTEPDPEKWDLNHSNTPKFNAGPKNVFSPSGKNNFSSVHENPVMREQLPSRNNASEQFFGGSNNDGSKIPNVPIPPPNAKVTFCDTPRSSSKSNLFPVVNPSFNAPNTPGGVHDMKVSLAQRLASVLVKIGMVDVPAPLLQEMLMKIGAFSSSPRQDISENEILSILKRLGYL